MSAYDITDCGPEQAAEARDLIRGVLCGEFDAAEDPTDSEDLQDIQATYAPEGNRFLITMIDGQVVATGALLRLSSQDCELKWLFARHDHRREGLASALVGKLLPFAVQNGYKRVLLEIRPEMAPYRKVYRRYGFDDLPDEHAPRAKPFMVIDL
jgi:GNAT superfamily N-acetyltransferase